MKPMVFFVSALLFVVARPTTAATPADSKGSNSAIGRVEHRPLAPHAGEAIVVTATLTGGPKAVSLEYQVVDPGTYIELADPAFRTNWVSLPMTGPIAAGTFSVTLPGAIQQHRRLVRYRIVAVDAAGLTNRLPAETDAVPNFAWFASDGVPGWRGAIDPRGTNPSRLTPAEFPAAVMRSVQAYHFIGRKQSVENVTWREQDGGREYKYTGTIVVDGRVYDHIRYRARGGVWRYAMGKNMWKFDFNHAQPLEARDDYGKLYPVPWSKLNLRACIDQGDYGMRGNQGMFEAVGFRLFNLTGVESPLTHWIQLRIIDEADEAPDDQYRGDFWGLYLAIENEDGRFLEQHGLPAGNLFKMEGGDGILQSHASGAITNKSDLHTFMSAYRQNPPSDWWRANVDLPRYYSYRSIIEAIHHYDCDEGGGKNYDFYLNPETKRWQAVPWDLDLAWADNMYGGGDEPFRSRVLARPELLIEYQNRLREIRDLLYNPEQAGALIDECAWVIDPLGRGPSSGRRSIVDADRAKWDFHPAMAIGGKAGKGLFYRAASSRDFAGMVQLMKDYVVARSRWIDTSLLRDAKIPAQPTVTYAGPEGYPADRLVFRAGEYKGAAPFAAMQWRLATAVVPSIDMDGRPVAPGKYEITPVWESGELKTLVSEVTLPGGAAAPGRSYRLRVRFKDVSGRWSHWSTPLKFNAGR